MTAKKIAAVPDDAPAVTEQLADDVAAEGLAYEPGTPFLLPHLAMPRMRRAKAYGALGQVQAQNAKTSKDEPAEAAEGSDAEPDPNAVVEIDPLKFGERYLVVGLIEEYLAVCARDEDEFRRWALEVDDAVMVKTFNTYMKINQPGEANSSAS